MERTASKPGVLRRAALWISGKSFDDWTLDNRDGTLQTNDRSPAPGQKINYAREVGTGLDSSVLMSPIRWIQRTLPEAPLRLSDAESGEPIQKHPLLDLVAKPNQFYTSRTLWQAVVYSWIVDGNSYWLKRRNADSENWYSDVAGDVRELWWVPHWRIQPAVRPGSQSYITHYELRRPTGGAKIDVPIENVVHFRNGIDPLKPRYGLSVIFSELREIWTDSAAAMFTASLLQNIGIPGLVVAPKMWPGDGGGDVTVIPDSQAVKEYVERRFTGRNRGRALVFEAPTDISTIGYSPEQMALGHLRNTVEERVCAALGIPASVIGFGTGLQQTKVGATMASQIRLAWTGGVIPMQNVLAEQLAMSLLPDFEENPEQFRVAFDTTDIAALQPDEDAMIRRINTAVQGGWLRVDHAQALAGFEVDETQNVYLRRSGTDAIPAETEMPVVMEGPPEL